MFGKKKEPSQAPISESDTNAALNSSNKLAAENTKILAVIAKDYLKDRKSKRRWNWVIRGLVLAYVGFLVFAWVAKGETVPKGSHTALIELNGLISPNATSADDINGSLRRAFDSKDTKGVILRINSPGGTPVQAAKINQEIYRLKDKHPDKPFHVVISDVCASGGYYVAVAADTIYAHPSSIVGSIGVRMDSFGFVDVMEKVGVERRLITAGEDKGMLDPFSPVEPTQVEHARDMLKEVHQQFIDAVKKGRGDRLDTRESLFGGLFWSGERAKELGLIDDFAGVKDVARDVIEEERVVLYSPKKSAWKKLLKDIGATLSAQLFESSWQLH